MRGPNFRKSSRARTLRRVQTDAELLLWHRLRDRQLVGYKFRRQVPIGPFYADFARTERKLIVEVDGGQHIERADYDATRSDSLQRQGYEVLRFWNDDVLKQIERVLEEIIRALMRCENRTPP